MAPLPAHETGQGQSIRMFDQWLLHLHHPKSGQTEHGGLAIANGGYGLRHAAERPGGGADRSQNAPAVSTFKWVSVYPNAGTIANGVCGCIRLTYSPGGHRSYPPQAVWSVPRGTQPMRSRYRQVRRRSGHVSRETLGTAAEGTVDETKAAAGDLIREILWMDSRGRSGPESVGPGTEGGNGQPRVSDGFVRNIPYSADGVL